MTDITNVNGPILVAIDFSEDSKAALIWACAFAERTGAELVLLHVVHDLASHPGFYFAKKSKHLQPMQEVAESMMEEFLDIVRSENPGLQPLERAALQLVPGLPPTRIVEVAGLLNASQIVMGSRGMTGLTHKRLGAVAQRVAELSAIPVVLLKSETHGSLDKKALKRREKQKKQDRKRLKAMLGLKDKSTNGGEDG